MFFRIALLLVTLFWLTMNYLLWRAEFGGAGHLGSLIPTEVVWRKILTAPDNSSLDIFHHGKKVGYCRWTANAGLDAHEGRGVPDEGRPSASVDKTAGYRLDLEGNVVLGETRSNLLYSLGIKLDSSRAWQELNARLVLGRDVLAVQSIAAEKSLSLRMENDGARTERRLKFGDLQNPQALARTFDLPLPMELFGGDGEVFSSAKTQAISIGLDWEARDDRVTIGHNSMRVYRLQARILDRYQIVVLVSPVGEILRVELPDDWLLVYDQMGAM